MNDSPLRSPADQAAFEELRARWERAKATGTTVAFARELFAECEIPPPRPDSAYASEEERDLYAKARELSPFKPSNLLDILPLYFGDEEAIPFDRVLAEVR
jgi:hypothetical protein